MEGEDMAFQLTQARFRAVMATLNAVALVLVPVTGYVVANYVDKIDSSLTALQNWEGVIDADGAKIICKSDTSIATVLNFSEAKNVTLNKLTKYVHKILGVYSLDCDYDINQEKCRCCNRKKLKVKREENINE